MTSKCDLVTNDRVVTVTNFSVIFFSPTETYIKVRATQHFALALGTKILIVRDSADGRMFSHNLAIHSFTAVESTRAYAE